MVRVPGLETICYINKDITLGAQTKRRGDAGPGRKLLRGVASPAAFITPVEVLPFAGKLTRVGAGRIPSGLPGATSFPPGG
jgi:hypothetical protein